MVGRRRIGVLLVLLLAGLGPVLLVGGSGTVLATNNTTVAPLYNATPAPVVDNASWSQGRHNVTLENVSSYLGSFGPLVIGTGDGNGVAGALITGLLVFGIVISLTGPSRPGTVAGGVLGSVVAAAMVSIGLAPQWILAIVLFAIATLLGAVFLRVVR